MKPNGRSRPIPQACRPGRKTASSSTGGTYKDKTKLTFAHGAALPDPAGVFNASLDAGTRRAIDFHEGDKINEKALKALIRAAVAFNTAQKK